MDWSIRQLLVVVIFCFCSSVRSEEWSLTNLPPDMKGVGEISWEDVGVDVPMPPVITKQAPTQHIVDPRELIVIDCEATGSPEIRYSWLKNGRELDVDSDPSISWSAAPNSGTITIELDGDNPDKSYEGKYQCRAANHRGTAVTNEIEVIITASPLFAFAEDREITVPVGAQHVLKCLSILGEAIPPPTIYWTKDGSNPIDLTERISIDAENSLIFANVEEGDAGEYSCRAEYSKLGTIRIANTLTLIVDTASPRGARAPSFLKRDINLPPVNRGEDLTLRCITEGLPTPEVRWRRTSGGSLPSARARVVGTSLIIEEVVERDAGSYECTASNSLGKDTYEVMVTVNAAPYWKTEPEGQMLAPGDDATILCEAAGTPTPEVSWKRNGEPLGAKHGLIRDHHFEEKLQDQANRRVSGTTLSLQELVKDNSAVYQCIARNNLGTRITNAYINVVELPPIMLTAANKKYAYVQDQDAQLDCLSFGSPKPEITWHQFSNLSDVNNNTDGSDRYKEELLAGDRYQVLSNGTLVITTVSTEDDGKYKCMAINKFGEEPLQAELSVKRKTTIATPPIALEVRAGNEAQFVCAVDKDPDLELTITWLKNGIPIMPGSRIMQPVLGTLLIKDTINSDSAIYTCLARTTRDEASAQAALSVIDVPEPPMNLQLSNQADSSVTLSWNVGSDNNSPIEGYTIQYEENRMMPGEWQEMKVIDGKDILTADLDLNPWLTYQFRVTARNKVGESEPSDATEGYTTPAAAPSSVPGGIKGEGTEPTNMVISWEPLPGLQQNGPGLKYEVRYRQQPEARKRRQADSDWTTETVNDPNGNEFIVEDTPTYTAYEITVQAKNDFGDGPLSDVVVGYSGEDFPAAAVENTAVRDVQPRSVRLDWDPVDEESVNGDLKGYKVRYWSDDDPDNVMEKTFEGDEPTALIDGLTPFKNYNFTVVPYNGKGDGPPSSPPVKASTPESTPGAPGALRANVVDSKTLDVQWEAPLEPNGAITGYLLTYRTMPGPGVPEGRLGTPVEEVFDDPAKTSVRLEELDEQTWYRIELRAKTKIGPGDVKELETSTSDPAPETTTVMTTTDMATTEGAVPLIPLVPDGEGELPDSSKAPLKPETVEILDTGEDFINVSWVPAKVGPRPSQFYVEYRERDLHADDVVVNGTNSEQMWLQTESVDPDPYSETLQKTIDGLNPGTRYQLRVVASNNFGKGWTDIKETTTDGDSPPAARMTPVGQQGWFIGLMCAIAFLILILLIICFIKKSRGGKYSVSEKEDALKGDPETQPIKDDAGFGEYRPRESPDEVMAKPPTGSIPSLTGSEKEPGSETDSMAEYGDADPGMFNEDGSFIGQYGADKKQRPPEEPTSPAAFSTFV
ncbi:neuronal cell adhesion molecule-like isoform X2 [Branchiostoma floridae]|uniref:Neural cell adhesion molecule L1 n=1 Tax=Branchiostoma floridae TaxID=7739 RepID=A0A9J7L5L4_BRAFL|nr:neuronal cell adhesion molecule-like isoform X2 [Branchiostoma floridae]